MTTTRPPLWEFARYRSHKVVAAARITAIDPYDLPDPEPCVWLKVVGKDGQPLRYRSTAAWVESRHAAVGGYLVIYDDGYESWSPAKAFEDGYTRIVDEDPPT